MNNYGRCHFMCAGIFVEWIPESRNLYGSINTAIAKLPCMRVLPVFPPSSHRWEGPALCGGVGGGGCLLNPLSACFFSGASFMTGMPTSPPFGSPCVPRSPCGCQEGVPTVPLPQGWQHPRQWFSQCGLGTAALTSPGNVLEMHIHRPCPRPTEPETLGALPEPCFKQTLRAILMHTGGWEPLF